MTRTEKMEYFLTTRHYAVASSFGGSAMNAQRARCTAGRLAQSIEPHPKNSEDALIVLVTSSVSATLWKLSVLMLLLILMLKRMVSLLLKSQVQQAPSIAGCQMSLVPRSDLSISALVAQKKGQHLLTFFFARRS